jgi:hypothetical protein
MAAYPGLANYAHESGGSYRKLSFKGTNDLDGSQELNPILPSCEIQFHSNLGFEELLRR